MQHPFQEFRQYWLLYSMTFLPTCEQDLLLTTAMYMLKNVLLPIVRLGYLTMVCAAYAGSASLRSAPLHPMLCECDSDECFHFPDQCEA